MPSSTRKEVVVVWTFYIIGTPYAGVSNARYYAGITTDLAQRVKDHSTKKAYFKTQKTRVYIDRSRVLGVRTFPEANLLWSVPCRDLDEAERALEMFNNLATHHKGQVVSDAFSDYTNFFKILKDNAAKNSTL